METRRVADLRSRLAALAGWWSRARFDSGDGLPPADRTEKLAGLAVTAIAFVWITAVAFWEIGAPFGAGHYAAATAVATGGENMWRFGIVGAVPRVLADVPAPGDYYCHHPWGVFWTAALFVGVFGHHDWVCRLPAALMSSAMPWLLFAAGRALFGPLAGGLAAAAYVVTPITLAYASFFALEVPTLFAMALTAYAYTRFLQTSRRRFVALTLGGMALAASFDWTGFVFGGALLAALLVRGFVLRRYFPDIHFERFAALWAGAVTLLGAVGLFHLVSFAELAQLPRLLAQGEARAHGSSLPLAEVLESRRYWLLLAFTPLAIVVGKAAFPLLLARVVWLRRDAEVVPLAVLATAVFQYVVFKQGADIHFFWPQYFALYFAYAFAALFASASEAARFALEKLARERWLGAARWIAFAAGLLTAFAMLPDAARALVWARKSGGRFNEKGLIIHPDLDKSAVLGALSKTLPESASLDVDSSFKHSYWMDWTLRRPVGVRAAPSLRARPASTHFALDARFSGSATLRRMQRDFAVRAYGPHWIVDLRRDREPITGFATLPRTPSLLERWFVSSNLTLFRLEPDPFWTWELREHFGVEPNPPPARAPAAHELRSAHNLAVARGDAELAARYRGRLLSGVDRSVARDFDQGMRLLGVRIERGVSEHLRVYFEASEPLPVDQHFAVIAEVESAPAFSLVPRDETPWNVGMPFALPTSLWKRGFIYEGVTELMPRPGRERYVGVFQGHGAPAPTSGPAETVLFVRQ